MKENQTSGSSRKQLPRPNLEARKIVEGFTYVKGKLKKIDIKKVKGIIETEYFTT